MTEITVHAYGLVPSKFFDMQIYLNEPVSLKEIEKKLIEILGNKIPSEYITLDGLIDHTQVFPVVSGKRYDYDSPNVDQFKEIWFIMALAGG